MATTASNNPIKVSYDKGELAFPATTADDPCFRSVYMAAIPGKAPPSVHHYIAYRGVTLAGQTNLSTRSAYLPGDGTTATLLTVPESSEQPNSEVPELIYIHAEDLYIHAGDTFNFHGRSLHITAKRLIVVPGDLVGVMPAAVTFNISGVKAKDYDQKPLVVDRGTDGSDGNPGHNGDASHDISAPGMGGTGGVGLTGETGNQGGNFTFCGRALSVCGADAAVVVNAKGGTGGQGSRGGRGGLGGNGAWTNWKQHEDALDGGQGGTGGPGGRGGVGGKGGTIHIRRLPLELLRIEGQTGSAAASKNVTFETDVSGGAFGASGAGGKGGSGGDGGSWLTSLPSGPNWVNTKRYYAKNGENGRDGPTNTEARDEIAEQGVCTNLMADSLTLNPATPSSLRMGTRGLEAMLSTRLPLGNFAVHLDPFFLQMILRRLMFDYELVYGSQFDVDFEKTGSGDSKRFQDSVRWLIGVAEHVESLHNNYAQQTWPTDGWTRDEAMFVEDGDASNISMDIRQSAVRTPQTEAFWASDQYAKGASTFMLACKSFAGMTLREKGIDARDIYGESFRYLPSIRFDLEEFKQTTQALSDLELARGQYADIVAQQQADQKVLAGKVDKIDAMLATKDIDMAKADEQIWKAYENVGIAKKAMEAKQKDALDTISRFKVLAGLRAVYDGIEKLVGAVATCMMFTSGNVASTVRTGNALNVGTAGAGLLTGTDLQIFLEFVDIDEGLEGDALGKDINDKNAVALAAKHVRLLMVQEAKFRSMCDSSFNGVASQAKASFEALVVSAKVYHESLIEYQRKALARAQLNTRFAQAEAAKESAHQVDRSDLPSLMLLYQYYDVVYGLQKARTMRLYYTAIRTLTCLKLKRLEVSNQLVTLGSKQKVSGQEMHALIMRNLSDEIDIIADDFANNTSSTVPKSAVLTPTTHPDIFGCQALETGGLSEPTGLTNPIVLDVTTQNVLATLGISLETMKQVRMVDCAVILRGARNTAYQLPPPGTRVPKKLWPQVDLDIWFSRQFTVTDGKKPGSQEQIQYKFDVDAGSMTTSYRYNPRDPAVTETTSEITHTQAHMVDLGTKEPLPLLSPLTVWNIGWGQDIDVSKVTAVEIYTTIRGRASLSPMLAGPSIRSDEVAALAVNGEANSTAAGGNILLAAGDDEFPKLNPSLAPLPLTSLDYPRVEVVETPAPIDGANGDDAGGGTIVFPVTGGWVPRVRRAVALNLVKLTGIGVPGRPLNETSQALLTRLFPTNHPRRMELPRRSERGILAVGADTQGRTKHLIDAPRSRPTAAAVADVFDGLLDSIDKSGAADRYRTVHTIESLGDGHHGVIGGALDLLNAGEIFQDVPGGMRFRAVVYLLAAFGQGAMFIPPARKALVDALPTAAQKLSYLLLHEADIASEGLEFLSKGGKLTECMVRLGKRNLIGIADLQISYEGPNKDIIVMSATAVTTSIHVLVGVNRWMIRYNPRHPNELVFANILEGVHNNLLGDWGNIFVGGRRLIPLTWARMKYLVEGLRQGGGFELSRIDEVLKKAAPHLQRCTTWFRTIDSWSRWYVVHKAGQKSTVEWDNMERIDHEPTALAELDKLPEEMLADILAEHARLGTAPKFYEGVPEIRLLESVLYPDAVVAPGANPTWAGDGPLNTSTSAEVIGNLRKRVEQRMGDLMYNDTTRDALKKDVDKVNDAFIAQLKDKKRSPQALYDLMWKDPEYQMELRKVAKKGMLNSISTSIISEVRGLEAFKDMSGPALFHLVRDSMECHITSALLDRGGLFETYARLRLLEKTGAATMTQDEASSLLRASIGEVNTRSDAVRRAAAEAAAARAMDPGDPRRESAVEKAERAERELAEELREAEATRGEYGDVDGIARDPSGAQAAAETDRDEKERDIKEKRNNVV